MSNTRTQIIESDPTKTVKLILKVTETAFYANSQTSISAKLYFVKKSTAPSGRTNGTLTVNFSGLSSGPETFDFTIPSGLRDGQEHLVRYVNEHGNLVEKEDNIFNFIASVTAENIYVTPSVSGIDYSTFTLAFNGSVSLYKNKAPSIGGWRLNTSQTSVEIEAPHTYPNGAGPTVYKLKRPGSNITETFPYPGAQTSHTYTGLSANTAYLVSITIQDIAGRSTTESYTLKTLPLYIDSFFFSGMTLPQKVDSGGTKEIQILYDPSDASIKQLNVSLSKTGLATASVDTSGLLTITGAENTKGTLTITLTPKDGGGASPMSIELEVVRRVESISLNTSFAEVQLGTSYQAVAVVRPEEATDVAVIWVSSNTAVAAVNAEGLVTSVGVGQCQISVTTVDGGFAAQFDLRVVNTEGFVALNRLVPGDRWDYRLPQQISANLIRLYNQIGGAGTLTSIDFSDGYYTALPNIKQMLNDLEGNIDTVYAALEYNEPTYGESVRYGNSFPKRADLNRWIDFCNAIKASLE